MRTQSTNTNTKFKNQTKTLVLMLAMFFVSHTSWGQCKAGDCLNGYGTLIYSDNSKYVGQFKYGKRNGQGVCFFADDTKYSGTWKDDQFNGEGRFFDAEGEVTVAIWENGKVVKNSPAEGCIVGDCSNGFSTYVYANGMKCIGLYKNGEPGDQIAVYYPNGTKYVGKWSGDDRNGRGTYYQENGTSVDTFWVSGNPASAKNELRSKGCITGNCHTGNGTYVYHNSTRYEGDFNNRQAHGKGTCYYNNGDIYIGGWKYHNFEGYGTMYMNNGEVQKGIWRAGEYLGQRASSVKVKPKPASAKKPKIWAVVVGVASYTDIQSLRYTDDDAYRMYAFLKSPQGGAIPDEQIRILVDESATKDRILKTMNDLFGKADPNDVIVFYFSGHGLKGAFLPHDYNGTVKLYHKDINAIFKQSRAKHKICIADACHAGSLGSGKSATSAMMSYYDAFDRTTGGTALLLSSKAEETSIENNGLRQGIFSHFVMKGLKGAADKDRNTLVTIDELFHYVEKEVRYYTNNHQSPVIYGKYDRAMPLGVVRYDK